MTTKALTPKGMRDFSPSVMFRRNYISSVVKSAFEKYGFLPIETPAMENLETLTGKYGEEGDRLIFKILNSGDFFGKVDQTNKIDSNLLINQISSKALRYDLTVPFARYVSQNRNDITFPFKRYQMQNVWRADRPQKGRFREFFQCDADIIGSDSLLSEIEIIQLSDEIFTNLGMNNIEICINNRKVLLGMTEVMGERDRFNDIVIAIDKLDKIGVNGVIDEIKKKGVSMKGVSILNQFLRVKELSDLKELLDQSEIGLEGVSELLYVKNNIDSLQLNVSNLKFDISLARGIDYYTGCILEVKQNDINVGSLAGGGRYDNLTSIFGLQDISGLGISFGIDRIYMLMEEKKCFPADIDQGVEVIILNFGEEESIYSLKVLEQLRQKNISCELYPDKDKIKKQMNYANKKRASFVIMIGEDEIKNGKISIKDMSLGTQSLTTIEMFVNQLR